MKLDNFKNMLLNLKHYNGKLGSFSYDPKMFQIVTDKTNSEFLLYIGNHKENIRIPDGVLELTNTFLDKNVENIESVILPDSVTKLDNRTFYQAINLRNIRLSNSLVEIGNKCFKDCRKLQKVKIPDSVHNLGQGCFCDCRELEDVILSSNLQKLEEHTFQRCGKLQEIVIPPQIKFIGSECFAECRSLEKVYIARDTKFEDNCFHNCHPSFKFIYYTSICE